MSRPVSVARTAYVVPRADEVAVAQRLDQGEIELAREQRPAGPERHRSDRDDHLVEEPGLGDLPIWVPFIIALAFSTTVNVAAKRKWRDE